MSSDTASRKTDEKVRPAGGPTPTEPPGDGASAARSTPSDRAKTEVKRPAAAGTAQTTAAPPSTDDATPHRPAAAGTAQTARARTGPTGAPRPAARAMAMMRVPGFAPFAPVAGWLVAWGAAALAATCLLTAGLDLGFGLGLVEGAFGTDGFAAGAWIAIVQAGAFLLGGYVAARSARGRGLTHAVLAWAVAMIATGADAIVADWRDAESVLEPLYIPFWIGSGLGQSLDAALALGAFAVAALAGVLIGGAMGAAANRAATREVTVAPGDEPPRAKAAA